jgi:hypothetical protein
MIEKSQVVRQLTIDEVQDILLEIESLSDCWGTHRSAGALRYGKTAYLQLILSNQFKLRDWAVELSNFDKCPKTHNILQKIADGRPLGRCYWHRLMPGDKIEPHDDTALVSTLAGRLAHRYQIYLDSDPNFILSIDDELISSEQWEYSIIDFALTKRHYYQNNSNKPWFLLVFDVLAY